jgi:uncharacterized protein
MKSRSHDPRRLDVGAFAAEGAAITGHWPLAGMPRIVTSEMPAEGDEPAVATGAPEASDVEWSAQGELRPVPAGRPETWLSLSARTTVRLQCQRCLCAMDVPLGVSRRFRFVADEVSAERLDEEIEDEVLVLGRSLDLHELVEDELLLAMPIVPRHDVCPEAPTLSFGEEDVDDQPGAPAHPFAVLAALKKKGAGGEGTGGASGG